MLGHASRLLLLAPALTYGLGAAFIAAAYGLGASPAEPATWQAFLTLAPIIREPVYLVGGLPGIGDTATLALFSMLALAGGALALSPQRTGRTRFVYGHLALLILFYAMGQSGVFTASYPATSGGAISSLDWRFDFASFPTIGFVLLVFVAIACAASHLQVLRSIHGQMAARRAIEARLLTSLLQFA